MGVLVCLVFLLVFQYLSQSIFELSMSVEILECWDGMDTFISARCSGVDWYSLQSFCRCALLLSASYTKVGWNLWIGNVSLLWFFFHLWRNGDPSLVVWLKNEITFMGVSCGGLYDTLPFLFFSSPFPLAQATFTSTWNETQKSAYIHWHFLFLFFFFLANGSWIAPLT